MPEYLCLRGYRPYESKLAINSTWLVLLELKKRKAQTMYIVLYF